MFQTLPTRVVQIQVRRHHHQHRHPHHHLLHPHHHHAAFPLSPCMKDGKCSKKFPKDCAPETILGHDRLIFI
jgi:hypothetical protein